MNNSMQSKNNSKVSVMPGMNTLKNEEGFVLVAALMILVILVIVGITATNTSNLEMQIAANERFAKQAFYQADGGTDVGINLAYENALCLATQNGFKDPGGGQPAIIDGNITVYTLALADPVRAPVPLPTDALRDAVFYPDGAATVNAPHTNLSMQGDSVAAAGAGQSQISGYLGLGYGSAAGGTDVLYTINSQHVGVANSVSTISLQWRMSGFLINSASSFDCNY